MTEGKCPIEYRYICFLIKKDDEDGEIKVQGLRLTSGDGREFVAKDQDFFVYIDIMLEKLDDSEVVHKNRTVAFIFQKSIVVYGKI